MSTVFVKPVSVSIEKIVGRSNRDTRTHHLLHADMEGETRR